MNIENSALNTVKFNFTVTNPGKRNSTILFTLPSYIMIKVLHQLGSDIVLPFPNRYQYVLEEVHIAYKGYGKWVLYQPSGDYKQLMKVYNDLVNSVNSIRGELDV